MEEQGKILTDIQSFSVHISLLYNQNLHYWKWCGCQKHTFLFSVPIWLIMLCFETTLVPWNSYLVSKFFHWCSLCTTLFYILLIYLGSSEVQSDNVFKRQQKLKKSLEIQYKVHSSLSLSFSLHHAAPELANTLFTFKIWRLRDQWAQ